MKPFQLLIKPAGPDCNLQCDYCFYRRVSGMFPGRSHRMSREILKAMIQDFLSERFPTSVFCWQGGEPTMMGLEFFKEAIELQKRAGVDGQTVGNSLQTNGVLIDKAWADFMHEYHFLVGLSLDGPKEIHDSYRKAAGSLSSWSKAMDAAKRMSDSSVDFNVLCVVNDKNAAMGGELYQWFLDQGFCHVQFIPCVEAGTDSRGLAPFSVAPEAYGRFLCEAFDLWHPRDQGRICVRTFDSFVLHHLQGRAAECTFGRACNSYLVVEHNGDVFPCDFFVTEPLRLGNLMSSRLRDFFNSPIQMRFSSKKTSKIPQCQSCRWMEACHGGCQKDRLIECGPASVPTILCEGYRMFFEHAWDRLKSCAETVQQNWSQERPNVQANAGVGRNDPCPCGSGLKVKKCCGRQGGSGVGI